MQGVTKTIKDLFMALTGREIITPAEIEAPFGN
jgi:hypothetical protein